jgi:hypothetical protein
MRVVVRNLMFCEEHFPCATLQWLFALFAGVQGLVYAVCQLSSFKQI